MNAQPLRTHSRGGGYLLDPTGGRNRLPPTARRLARRRLVITITKWLLPVVAMALLALVALWPEVNAVTSKARMAMKTVSGAVGGAHLTGARYNGVDAQGRPYTVTAATAWQIGTDKIGLSKPKGDITLRNGSWVMLKAQHGMFDQARNQLDLSNDVTLYRDDGTTVKTASASIDLKAGAAAGSDPVHAQGPFGTLNAQGFTLMDKGGSIDFSGPAHVVLNGAHP